MYIYYIYIIYIIYIYLWNHVFLVVSFGIWLTKRQLHGNLTSDFNEVFGGFLMVNRTVCWTCSNLIHGLLLRRDVYGVLWVAQFK